MNHITRGCLVIWPCTPPHCKHKGENSNIWIFSVYMGQSWCMKELLILCSRIIWQSKLKMKFPTHWSPLPFAWWKQDVFFLFVSYGAASERTQVSSGYHATVLRLLGSLETWHLLCGALYLHRDVASHMPLTALLSLTDRGFGAGQVSNNHMVTSSLWLYCHLLKSEQWWQWQDGALQTKRSPIYVFPQNATEAMGGAAKCTGALPH